MITATKRVEFDAAHRVAGHEGKCKSLHGHRYAVELTLVRSDAGVDDTGFVVDFGVIKERVGGWIDEHLDHTTLYDEHDEFMVAMRERYLEIQDRCPELAGGELRSWYAMKRPPTAENIAAMLHTEATKLMPRGVQVLRVRVYETPTSYADFDYRDHITLRPVLDGLLGRGPR